MTPAFYRPGTRHTVQLSGARLSERRVVGADASGKIQITVPLGPGNPYAEFSSAARSSGSRVFTTTVRVH